LTVKALNIRQVPLVIQQGDSIFTVVFSKLDEATSSPYALNLDAGERERKFNQVTVEKSADSLSRIIEVNRDGPFPGRDEIRALIWKHWSTIGALALSVLAVVFSGYAAWASYVQLTRDARSVSFAAQDGVLDTRTTDRSSVSVRPAKKPLAGNEAPGSVQNTLRTQVEVEHGADGGKVGR
jgi:hypothetical protein